MIVNSATVDYTLYGENLQAWRDWLASQEDQQWLLTWGLRVNGGAITASTPLWLLATVIGFPLVLVSLLTGGLVFWPFHWLLIRPLTALVLWTSALWWALPLLRPVLLLVGPLIVIIDMVVISLIPDGNPDHQEARRVLCHLWPLSRHRLEWIAEHGNGIRFTSPVP